MMITQFFLNSEKTNHLKQKGICGYQNRISIKPQKGVLIKSMGSIFSDFLISEGVRRGFVYLAPKSSGFINYDYNLCSPKFEFW